MPNPFESGNFAWLWYESWLAAAAAVFALGAAVYVWRNTGPGLYGSAVRALFAIGFIGTVPLAVERIGLDIGGREDVMAVLSFLGSALAAVLAVLKLLTLRLRRWYANRQLAGAAAGAGATAGVTASGPAPGTSSNGTGGGPAGAGLPPSWLHFRSGPNAGQSVPLISEVTRIGRDPSNDVVLDDPSVSRSHAEIVFANGAFTLSDAGSSSGVVVDGRAIGGATALQSGATIKLGGTELMFSTSGVAVNGGPAVYGSAGATVYGSSGGPVTVRATTVDALKPGATVIDEDRRDMLTAWLAVTGGPSEGEICQLSAERTMIGRDGSNDLVVNDPTVSRQHAVVVARDDVLYLVDLGSTSGVSVNGKRASGVAVRSGASVRIGDTELEIVAVQAAAGVPSGASGARGSDMTVLDSPAGVGGVAIVRSGPDAGRTFDLDEGDNVIGRERGIAIELSDPAVSRRHAMIRRQGEGYVVYDLASRGGTNVDGKRLGGARIKAGDRIKVGRSELSLMRPRGG